MYCFHSVNADDLCEVGLTFIVDFLEIILFSQASSDSPIHLDEYKKISVLRAMT
jgi:hypothetical protein